jgi:hypothetical protein
MPDQDPIPPAPAAAAGAPARAIERLSDLAEQIRPPTPPPDTFEKGFGARLMLILLAVICGLTLAFALSWWFTRPSLQDASKLVEIVRSNPPAKALEPQAVAEVLSKMQQEHNNGYRDFFQLLVMSALVPLFTLLAGYVFGKESSRRQAATSQES